MYKTDNPPFVDLAAIAALRDALRSQGIRNEVLPNDGLIGTHAINVWADKNDRFPSTTVYPPQHEDDAWNWGGSYEFYAPRTASSEDVANLISQTMNSWVRN